MAAPAWPGASRAPVGAALSLVLPVSSQPHLGSGLTSWPPRAVSFHPLTTGRALASPGLVHSCHSTSGPIT